MTDIRFTPAQRADMDYDYLFRVMTPQEFAERMRELVTLDPEYSHAEADKLMAKLLRSLGYGEGVDVYDDMTRWYS